MREQLFQSPYLIRLVIDPFNEPKKVNEYVKDYITVTKNKKYGGDGWSPAEINWSAIGATDPMRTLVFAKALEHAAAMARLMDKDPESWADDFWGFKEGSR